jgi:hypothetical protein
VEEHKEIRKTNIENLTKVNKASLKENLLKPVSLITMTQNFVKRTTQELKKFFYVITPRHSLGL